MGVFTDVIMLLMKPVLAKSKGKRGEKRVSKALKKAGCLVLDDLYFLKADGSTCQIDHIAIHNSGLYCVETKNYAGKISGSPTYEKWVQYLGKQENRFYSPLRQNLAHCHVLKELLGEGAAEPKALVVFASNNAPKGMDEVINLQAIGKFFARHKEKALTYEERLALEGKIKGLAIENPDKKGHVKAIKKKQKEIRKGICPHCEVGMEEKKGRYGPYYKCPKCGYQVSLNKAKTAGK